MAASMAVMMAASTVVMVGAWVGGGWGVTMGGRRVARTGEG
jgi:hypothetical protein